MSTYRFRVATLPCALIGAMAGAAIGFIPQFMLLEDGLQVDVSMVILVAGAFTVGVIAAALGSSDAKPILKFLFFGAIIGIVLGAVIGDSVWAPFMSDPGPGALPTPERVVAEYRTIGIGLGATIGFMIGLVCGTFAWLLLKDDWWMQEP